MVIINVVPALGETAALQKAARASVAAAIARTVVVVRAQDLPLVAQPVIRPPAPAASLPQ
jgi:hypothetical protein